MKKLLLLIPALALILAACTPSQGAIQTAIAETLTAAPTLTPTPTKTPTPQPTSTSSPTVTVVYHEAGSFAEPYPYGLIAFLEQHDQGETLNLSLGIKNVIRGEDAWKVVYAANRFNDKPPTGMEYILIELYAQNTGVSGMLSLNKYTFSVVSKGRFFNSFDYSPCCLEDAGYQKFEVLLAPGGEASGWIGLMVNVDDPAPILAVGVDSSGKGGVYFALTP